MVNLHYVCFSGYRGKVAEEVAKRELEGTEHSVKSSGVIFNNRVSLIKSHFVHILSYFQQALDDNLFDRSYTLLATQVINDANFLNRGETKHIFFDMVNITLDVLLKDRKKKTIEVLRNKGYGVKDFFSEPFTPLKNDVVIAMDQKVENFISPIYQGNIILLEGYSRNGISMPLGGSKEQHIQSFDEIKEAVKSSLDQIID